MSGNLINQVAQDLLDAENLFGIHHEHDKHGITAQNTTRTVASDLAILLTDITGTLYTELGPPHVKEITLTKGITNPLIEYSFLFGDVRSSSTLTSSSYARLGINLHIDSGSGYDLKQSVGSVNSSGGLDGAVESTSFGSGAGKGKSYYPVFIRYIHPTALSVGHKIKVTLAATDVTQCRIRDLIITVRQLA
jgi:hypothetical protein